MALCVASRLAWSPKDLLNSLVLGYLESFAPVTEIYTLHLLTALHGWSFYNFSFSNDCFNDMLIMMFLVDWFVIHHGF